MTHLIVLLAMLVSFHLPGTDEFDAQFIRISFLLSKEGLEEGGIESVRVDCPHPTCRYGDPPDPFRMILVTRETDHCRLFQFIDLRARYGDDGYPASWWPTRRDEVYQCIRCTREECEEKEEQ